jgi:hypothetical protein
VNIASRKEVSPDTEAIGSERNRPPLRITQKKLSRINWKLDIRMGIHLLKNINTTSILSIAKKLLNRGKDFSIVVKIVLRKKNKNPSCRIFGRKDE